MTNTSAKLSQTLALFSVGVNSQYLSLNRGVTALLRMNRP
jgi:hypothetical protein